MTSFEDLSKQISEDQEHYLNINGVLVDISNIKPLNPIEITERYLQEKLGRKWKACLKRMQPIVKWFTRHYYGKPVMFSVTMLKEMRNKKSWANGCMRSNLALQDLLNLEVIKCVHESYNPIKSQARLYTCESQTLLALSNLISNILQINVNSSSSDNPSDLSMLSDSNLYTETDQLKYELEEFEEEEDEEEVEKKDEEKKEKKTEKKNEEEPIVKLLRSEVAQLCKQQNRLEKDPRYRYRINSTGLRPYAPFCSMPTKKKQHKIKYDTYREDMLGAEYHEYDRIASIYNLNRYIQKGELKGNNRQTDDFYREFYNCKTENERNDIKILMMTLMFGTHKQFNSSVQDTIGYYLEEKSNCRTKALKFGERFKAIGRLMQLKTVSHSTIHEMNTWRKEQVDRLENIIGKRIGPSIFLYEAYVNLNTEISLRQAGYKCKTVYDGFYTNCTEEVWWEEYKKSLKKLDSLLLSQKIGGYLKSQFHHFSTHNVINTLKLHKYSYAYSHLHKQLTNINYLSSSSMLNDTNIPLAYTEIEKSKKRYSPRNYCTIRGEYDIFESPIVYHDNKSMIRLNNLRNISMKPVIGFRNWPS